MQRTPIRRGPFSEKVSRLCPQQPLRLRSVVGGNRKADVCSSDLWYATLNCPVGEQDRTGERKARLSRLFEGWREPIGHPIVTVAERDPCSALASGGAFPLKRSPRFARSSSSGFGARLQ